MIPVVSGRDYRIQLMTTKELYRIYSEEVKRVGNKKKKTDIPLSITTINQILAKWKIHHSKDTAQCPTCKFLKTYEEKPPPSNLEPAKLRKHQNKLLKHKNHKLIAQSQHNAFKTSKQKLTDTKSTNTMIVLHDFT